ncbi:MAG: glutamate--tRNA ligase [Proteobacteria bacterium]|jgi:glutamyl-tRNA synthetase|nr:glutamate--tRNA ligase [Pseudomonadota bacterium]
MSEIRLRFAPSPTGVLHLGGARTALFNWLYARHTGGKFLLRIEDTDHERSTDESTRAILDALRWLGMSWDEEPVIQSRRLDQHKEALRQLIDAGKVYKCYCTPEEREAMREKALAAGRTFIYDGRCDGLPERPGAPFVWRFRMPKTGETVVDDIVQGRVVTPNAEIEDLVIARADGSPLYNFVVVIDDAAMGITHVVRGKDHLTNTPKQIHIYRGLGLPEPRFAHLPLILGLSKRLRSAGIEAYRAQGYVPEAVNNYIARLGWSCGDQELFTAAELVEKFDLADVNRSEGALNLEKMEWTNQQHIQRTLPERLAALAPPFLAARGISVDAADPKLVGACRTVAARSKTLVELAEKIRFYFAPDGALAYTEDAAAKFLDVAARGRLAAMADALGAIPEWTEAALEAAVKAFCEAQGLKLKDVAQPTRVALTGEATGPGLYETMVVLGRESSLARLRRAAARG